MADSRRKAVQFTPHSDVLSRFPVRKSEWDRFKFGKKWYYKVAERSDGKETFCLDVGCGATPFPRANILCDSYLKKTPHRRMRELRTDGKPFILCDGCYLPFRDDAFDFVTCYYVLEHIDEPARLFTELKRVAKHGYIQCPSWFNEILYREDVHKWVITKKDGNLCMRPNDHTKSAIPLGSFFHTLYRFSFWRIFHAILDESLHLFTVSYNF